MKAVEGIVSWRTNTLDGENKPNKAGEAYIKLYQEEWRTSQELAVSPSTTASFSGFRGDYTVRIMKDGSVAKEIKFTLDGNISIRCVKDGLDLDSLNCIVEDLDAI